MSDRRRLNGPRNHPPAAPEVRFWRHVDKTDTCWLWLGSGVRGGYGQFYLDGRRVSAHRFAYKMLVEPIPDGYEVDHLCRVRNCVNPDHLEAVTLWENRWRANRRRKGIPAGRAEQPEPTVRECAAGHKIDVEIWRVRGGCPTCRRAQWKAKKSGRDTRQTHAA